MLFITVQSLPSFLNFSHPGRVPRLKTRQVPLVQWSLQVLVLISGSLLNNWAFAYNVPLTILIVFRSAGEAQVSLWWDCVFIENMFAGLPVSMLFGYLFSRKHYTPMQFVSPPMRSVHYSFNDLVQFSIIIVTAGVIMVTLSRTTPGDRSETSRAMSTEDLWKYSIGIGMLTVSLFCTGLLGLLQERTYRRYGPCWKEGVFYTVCAHNPLSSRPTYFTLIAFPLLTCLPFSGRGYQARNHKFGWSSVDFFHRQIICHIAWEPHYTTDVRVWGQSTVIGMLFLLHYNHLIMLLLSQIAGILRFDKHCSDRTKGP